MASHELVWIVARLQIIRVLLNNELPGIHSLRLRRRGYCHPAVPKGCCPRQMDEQRALPLPIAPSFPTYVNPSAIQGREGAGTATSGPSVLPVPRHCLLQHAHALWERHHDAHNAPRAVCRRAARHARTQRPAIPQARGWCRCVNARCRGAHRFRARPICMRTPPPRAMCVLGSVHFAVPWFTVPAITDLQATAPLPLPTSWWISFRT